MFSPLFFLFLNIKPTELQLTQPRIQATVHVVNHSVSRKHSPGTNILSAALFFAHGGIFRCRIFRCLFVMRVWAGE